MLKINCWDNRKMNSLEHKQNSIFYKKYLDYSILLDETSGKNILNVSEIQYMFSMPKCIICTGNCPVVLTCKFMFMQRNKNFNFFLRYKVHCKLSLNVLEK